jgi:hypothetical protein
MTVKKIFSSGVKTKPAQPVEGGGEDIYLVKIKNKK